MEIIYIVVLFIAPGMIVKELQDYFTNEKAKKDTVYSYLFHVVIDSIIVSIITICSMNILFNLRAYTLYGLLAILGSLKWLLVYLAIALFASIVWFTLKNSIIHWGIRKVRNLFSKKTKNVVYGKHVTVWNELLADENISGTWQVMSLYKDDTYISSGMRDLSIDTEAHGLEISLDRVEEVEEKLKEKPELFKIYCDYYNPSTGFRAVIYDQKHIQEHWYNE